MVLALVTAIVVLLVSNLLVVLVLYAALIVVLIVVVGSSAVATVSEVSTTSTAPVETAPAPTSSETTPKTAAKTTTAPTTASATVCGGAVLSIVLFVMFLVLSVGGVGSLVVAIALLPIRSRSSTSSTSVLEAALVGRILASLNLGPFGTGYIRRLSHALFALNNVKLNFLSIADRSQVLFLVVVGNCSLVDEYVLLGIVSVNKSVSISYVEPFDDTMYALGYYSLLLLRSRGSITAGSVIIVGILVCNHGLGLNLSLHLFRFRSDNNVSSSHDCFVRSRLRYS